MAKEKAFGGDSSRKKGARRRMAKVIISTKTKRNKYAFKESMVDQDSVRDFIKENKS